MQRKQITERNCVERPDFAGRVLARAHALKVANHVDREAVRMAVQDTLACVLAGWNEPATVNVRGVYPHVPPPLGSDPGDPEQAPLVGYGGALTRW